VRGLELFGRPQGKFYAACFTASIKVGSLLSAFELLIRLETARLPPAADKRSYVKNLHTSRNGKLPSQRACDLA
jgi:hypothetical protein